MDNAAAFPQTCGFDRDVIVRLPKVGSNRATSWRLTAAPYGLVDLGRLWYFTSNAALATTFRSERFKFEPTLFHKHTSDKVLEFFLVTQVHNYLYCGYPEITTAFVSFVQKAFKVCKLNHRTFPVMSCKIDQLPDDSFVVTHANKRNTIDITGLRANCNNKWDLPASATDFHYFKQVQRSMLCIGRTMNLVLLNHALPMPCKTLKLFVRQIKRNMPL